LLGEATQQLLDGNLEEGCSASRACINAVIGFEKLGAALGRSPKSLMRMFGPSGNPTPENLLGAIGLLQAGRPAFACRCAWWPPPEAAPVAAVIAQFVDMLALHAHGLRQGALRQPHRSHEFFGQDFADARGLAFRGQHGLPLKITMVVQIGVFLLHPGRCLTRDQSPLHARTLMRV
jgi:hypothetical protein